MGPKLQVSQFKGIVPNIFTMGNTACGFFAILSAFEGNIVDACWLVLLAGFLDAMDGKIARLSGTSSQFGVELDSLSDFLSFGIAPAVIVYVAKLQYLGKWGWLISIVFIMAASFRLARYNILADTGAKKDFLGLPTPMSAAVLVSFIIFSFYLWGQLEYSEHLVVLLILTSALMISQIEYDAVPDNLNTRRNQIKFAVIIVAAILLVVNVRLLLFPIMAIYIIIGLVRELYRIFYLGVGFVKKRQIKDQEME